MSTTQPIPSDQALHGRSGHKVIFADQLRALACLCVVMVHWVAIYLSLRDLVAQKIFATPLTGPNPRILDWIGSLPVNPGPFGVALFFLISGFVIPFSLSKTSRWRFLAARALRIYPTYLICLGIGLGAIYLSSKYWHQQFSMSPWLILQNASLYKGIGIDSIDMINWSLAVELKFYLIIAVLFPWIRSAKILPILGVAALIALTMKKIPPDFLYIPFMFIGTIFYYHSRQKITRVQMLAAIAALSTLFILAWPRSALKDQFPVVTYNYFYALLLFATAYLLRDRFRPIKPLDWLASISYPVYAVHSIAGYASLRLLMDLGASYYLALACTGGFVILLAYVIHRLVEMPTMSLGKAITGKFVNAGQQKEKAAALASERWAN